MADETNKIKTIVEVETSQAQASIIKLGAVASNTTKDLEERIAAKNEQVELQNELSKRTIDALTKEAKALEGVIGKEKEYEKALAKLNTETLKALKQAESGAATQDKLNQAFADGKDPVKNLDKATGGLIEKFKLFLANPIGIAVSALVGLFALFKEAVGRSESASGSFSIVMAKLSGIFNGIIAVIIPLVEWVGKKLVSALDNPKKAIKELGDSIVENLTNRVKSFLVLGDAIGQFFKGNFKAAAKLAGDGVLQLATGVTNATDKFGKLITTSTDLFNKAAAATDGLAGAERNLLRNRIEGEKTLLKFLNLEEKQRQIRDDTSRSMDDRLAANKELGRLLTEQSQIELKLANQTLGIEQLRRQATGETIESITSMGEAQKKILEIEERINGQRSEQLVNENSLRKEGSDLAKTKAADDAKEEADRLKAIADKNKAIAEAAKLLEDTRLKETAVQIEQDEIRITQDGETGERLLAQQLSLLERRKQLEIDNLISTEAERVRLAAEAHAAEMENIALTDSEKVAADVAFKAQLKASTELFKSEENLIKMKFGEAEESLVETTEAAKLAEIRAAADAAMGVAGDIFGVQKEMAVAQMIMAAPAAIGNVWKVAATKLTIPGMLAHGAVGTATTVVPIVKALADIKKTRFPGKKGGSKGSGGGGGSISSSASGGAAGVGMGAIADLAANNAARLGVDPALGGNATNSAASRIAGGTSSGVVFSESKYNDFRAQVAFKENKIKV
jgi:hypothetical protein